MTLPGIVWCCAVLAIAVTACGPGGGGGDEGADRPSARAMKAGVDQDVTLLGPRLAAAMNAELDSASGGFSTCAVASSHRYIGKFSISATTADPAADAEKLRTVLADAGFDDAEVRDGGGVVGSHAFVRATVSEVYPASFRSVQFETDCIDLDDEDAQLAEADEGTDYPELR